MGERGSTTRSRDLGTELVGIRKAAGLDAKALAEKLGWPGSKLSRIERGKQGSGSTVIHDQLMHLVFLAEWKRISIRVLPISAGLHAGLDGAFLLLDNKEGKPLVVLGTMVANVFLEGAEQVAKYEAPAKELTGLALPLEQSRKFIARLADEFDSSREEFHGARDLA